MIVGMLSRVFLIWVSLSAISMAQEATKLVVDITEPNQAIVEPDEVIRVRLQAGFKTGVPDVLPQAVNVSGTIDVVYWLNEKRFSPTTGVEINPGYWVVAASKDFSESLPAKAYDGGGNSVIKNFREDIQAKGWIRGQNYFVEVFDLEVSDNATTAQPLIGASGMFSVWMLPFGGLPGFEF